MNFHERPPFVCAITRNQIGVNIFGIDSKLKPLCETGTFTMFLPNYGCISFPFSTEYEIWHVNTTSRFVTHSTDLKRIYVGGDLEGLAKGETIPYLAYGLIEKQGQAENEVTMHAAVVAQGDQSILIIGKGGSGKTTLSLELCLKYGFKLVGNDLVVIKNDRGGIKAVGGTKHFFVRLEVLRTHHPQLLPHFPSVPVYDPWISRASILPSQISVQTVDFPVTINQAIVVHISSTEKSLKISPVDLRWARLYLFENLSRYIRRVCLPVLMGEDDQSWFYAPSLDSPNLQQKRAELIQQIICNLNLVHISGSLKEVARHIASTFGGRN